MTEEAQRSPKLKGIKAVIFDMDGLMVDSEALHVAAYNAVINPLGFNLTEEENRQRYIGVGDPEVIKDLLLRHKMPITEEEFSSKKSLEYERLQANVKANPGLAELMRKLKDAGVKMAIASNSSLSNITQVVVNLGLEDLVYGYLSGEDVPSPKPAPDLFLLTAQKIGVDPSDCLVLEDSPVGIAAAKAAGMKAFAIPSKDTLHMDFTDADRKLGSLWDVLGEIEFYSRNTPDDIDRN